MWCALVVIRISFEIFFFNKKIKIIFFLYFHFFFFLFLFFVIFIIEHNFKRYLTPEFQHIQPFWYYLPITIIALLPWIFWLAWFATRKARKDGGGYRRTQILFMAAWGVFPVLFFSLSKSKLPGYILPAVFPLGFVISTAATRTLKSRHVLGRYVL